MAAYSHDDLVIRISTPPYIVHQPVNDTIGMAAVIDRDAFTRGNQPNLNSAASATAEIAGDIYTAADPDIYGIEVTKDDLSSGRFRINFDIDGAVTADGQGLNSFLTLMDANGNVLATNADNTKGPDAGSADARDSFLNFAPVVAGIYYIEVFAQSLASVGRYTLNIGLGNAAGVRETGSDLIGTMSNDVLAADADSLIYGYAGNDRIAGDVGSDSLHGGDGADTIVGNAGDDLIFGDDDPNGGTWQVDEGPGDDDILSGGVGEDTIYGARGLDHLYGGSGNDTLDGGVGDDALNGGSGIDALIGGDGNDSMDGASGIDGLDGDSGNDSLTGGSGNDGLDGGSGNDTLTGGAGKDVLTGNVGADHFDFNALAEIGKDTTSDLIADFRRAQHDQIDITDIDANALLPGDQDFILLTTAGAEFTAAGQARFRFAGGFTYLDLNINSNPATAEATIAFEGHYIFAATDFIL